MPDIKKKLHSYIRRAEHITKGLEFAYEKAGHKSSTLNTELLQASIELEMLCRNVRRLLLQTSIISPEILTAQLCNIHDYSVEERDNKIFITLPVLPLKKPDHSNCSFISDPLLWCLKEYHKNHPSHIFESARITVCHCYPKDTPSRMVRDYDNIEVKKIIDVLALFFLHDDNMGCCEVLHTSRFHDYSKTEIIISDRF